jgi:glyceraldehyde-3-phosphate dehydrogenase (NADP+)
MPNLFSEIKTKAKIPNYKYFVDGEWQESRSRKLITIFSPIDRSILGRIQSITKKEADLLVTSSAMAYEGWSKISLGRRLAIMKKIAARINNNGKIFQKLLVAEIGKTQAEAQREVENAVKFLEAIILQAEIKPYILKNRKEKCEVNFLPRGVVLCITPFNFPLYTTITQVAPALLGGNSVVLKPSVYGAIMVLHLGRLFQKAGLPAGVLNIATGHSGEIGTFLVSHDLVKMIYFTGSSKVGKEIAQKSGLSQLVLEMGGKDAAIVLEDADLDKAAQEIVEGAFMFSGQRCMAIKRVIVLKKVKDQLLEKMSQYVKERFSLVGDPRDSKTQVGPVISDKQADYLEALIKDAKKKGAKIVCGGTRFDIAKRKIRFSRRLLELPRRIVRLRRGQGRYFCPTILDEVKTNMRIAWEEQFGPVLPVITVKSVQEAVNVTNASEYGLDASIFTRDLARARKLAEAIEVGQIFINMKPHRAPNEFPFTGTKNSGIGTQGIPFTQKEMVRIKSLRFPT